MSNIFIYLIFMFVGFVLGSVITIVLFKKAILNTKRGTYLFCSDCDYKCRCSND